MIVIRLDVMLARRKMSLTELSEQVGITLETLDRICRALQCQPGDLLEWEADGDET